MTSETPAGRDPLFLGIPVPLPQPARGRLIELDYPHFTVVLDADRRFAAVTAVDIDGASLQDVSRTGDWALDPRVAEEDQAGPDVYARNDLDRGHLVRRRDPGWGENAREATEATFFYTNAAPQVAGFNQSKELWLGLEDHVLAYAEDNDHRVSVFTAPVLADDDPPYRGIAVPRRFWKIAAWNSGTSSEPALAAAGFLLDQSELLSDLDEDLLVPPLGAFRTFQVPVREIMTLAGVDVGALADADVLTGTAVRPEPRELASLSDIVLG